MSNTYAQVKLAMAAGTPLEVICGTCPWDRLCVQRPAMTTAEVEAGIKTMITAGRQGGRQGARDAALAATAMYGGRDRAGDLCPVLVARLNAPEGRAVADGFRAVMQNLGAAT